MNEKTDVIVLSQTLYKEHDALVKVLSFDYGLMTFLARGVQKMQSKNRGVIQAYGIYQYHFDLKSLSALNILKQGELLVSNHHIQGDLMRSSIASLVFELSEFMLRNESNPELIKDYYTYLSNQLKRINEEDKLQHIIVLALVHFIHRYGIEPQLDACVLCDDTHVNSFSVEEGGFVCASCQKQIHSPIYSPEFLRHLRISSRVNETHFDQYKMNFDVSTDLVKIWLHFIEYHTGIQLKSWEFMRKWSIIV
jgi:DNA repair protein RecO (recombination protein O)